MDTENKVVFITGAASGIGKALAEACFKAGARAVIAADLDMETAKSVVADFGGRGYAVRLDVSSAADTAAAVEDVVSRYGQIDLYISNAGILYTDTPDFTVFSQTPEQWQRAWQVNVEAHVHACRAVLPAMIARGSGGFLITASAAGLLNQLGAASYSTTKHAAVGFAESLAITHGDDGIYVGALCPQAVTSNMSAGAEETSAALDGMLSAREVADFTLQAMREGKFMIRPHPNVEGYFKQKAENYDRWVGGMRKLRRLQMERTGLPL